MNLIQNRIGQIVLGLAVLGAVVLNCILLSRVGGSTYWALIALTIGLPPLAIGAALLLRRTKRCQPSLQSTPPSIQFWVVTGAIGCALAVVGIFSGRLWLMMIGQLLPPVAASFRGQFSLRRMFGVMTLLAVCMGMVSGLERWRDKTIRDNNQRSFQAIRKIKMDSIEKRRTNLESKRDRLSSEFYEQRKKSLDDEEAKLKRESISVP